MCDRTGFDGLGPLPQRRVEAEQARRQTLRRINTLRRRFGLGEIPAEQADRFHTLDLGRELARLERRAFDEDGEPDRAEARCGQLRIDWGR